MHLGEIQRLLKEYEPIAVCLQHVNDRISQIGNYFLASSSVPSEGALGTAIYVHHKVLYDNITFQTGEMQVSALRLYLNKNYYFNLYNLYNQPNCHYNLQHLDNVLNNVRDDFLLVGDFNAHSPVWDIHLSEADNNGVHVESFVDRNNLCILNDSEMNTYYSKTHGTFSSIDVSVCSVNIVDRFEWCVLDDLYTSDHFPILISCLNSDNTERIQRYNTDKADWHSFHLHTRHIPPYDSIRDHNDTNTFLVKFITDAADKSIPKSASCSVKRCVPWWSDSLQHLVKEKTTVGRRIDTLNKRFKKLSCRQVRHPLDLHQMVTLTFELSVLKPHFNKLSAQFRKEVIKGKIVSWQTYVSTLTERTPIQKIWEKFRKINGAYTKSPRHPLLYNGDRISDNKDIANVLGRNIARLSSIANLDDHFKSIKTKEESAPLNFETDENLYYNNRFTMEEFENALSSCTSSAPGLDMVNFDMLSHLAPLAKSYLLQFYNHLWVNHKFPSSWRHAIVLPFPKPGKDPSNPNNYRPISLTSCLCKLLEKMVNHRLTWCLKKNAAISPTQYGSQSGRSTLDSLAHLEDYIRRGFEQKKITAAIFFDIQKAYDTTWRHLIVKSLHQHGLCGNLPMFIRNFLEERTFQTRIENVYSDTFQLDCGVPQGSVLSGTLFVLAINNIVKQLPQGVQNSLYVDDFAIYYSSTNLRHLQRTLNMAITKIVAWTESVGFHLSIEKTQAILFYKDSRWKKNQDITLTMKNNVLKLSTSVKFLGLVFDTHLNWKRHVAYVKSKCHSAMNLIRKVAHTVWGAKRSILISIYKALVQSVLDYGCPIYGSASASVLAQLNPVQTQCMRICTGAFKSSPNPSVLCESGLPPLSIHRDYVTMKSALRILSGDSPTKSLFTLNDIFINNHSPSFPIRANRLLGSAIHGNVLNFLPSFPTPPPWVVRSVKVCTHLSYLSKSYVYTPSHHKQHTLEHIRRKGQHYEIYTDGSKTDQGVGFAAVSSYRNFAFSLPSKASVFTAELMAILYALKIVNEVQADKFVIYSDSRSAVEALRNYTHPNPLVTEIKLAFNTLNTKGIDVQLCWIPAHVGVDGNEKADQAAKHAISLPRILFNIPITDYITSLKSYAWNVWQNTWDEVPNTNKLKHLKLTVKPWSSSIQATRKLEVILTRLRIGHSRLTHGHLMKSPNDPPPVCPQCNMPLTIRHLFGDCIVYANKRRLLFGNKTFNDIFEDSPTFDIRNILSFLHDLNIVNEI